MQHIEFFDPLTITDDDSYPTILLRLICDLNHTIKMANRPSYEKAYQIIQVCCEPMFDELIDDYDWNLDEVEYAELVLVHCMESAATELIKLLSCRPRKLAFRKFARAEAADLSIATALAYVMSIAENVDQKIQDSFMKDHGAMYFKR